MSNLQSTQIQVQLPNGSIREIAAGRSVSEIAHSISSSLGKSAVAANVNGQLVDLRTTLSENCQLEIITSDQESSAPIYRATAASILAQAIKRLYGADQVKLGMGAITADGFYYDVELPSSISSDDLPAIEQQMKQIVAENLLIEREEWSRAELLNGFHQQQEPYKLAVIHNQPEQNQFTVYKQGEFFDIDPLPRLMSTGKLQAFKLMNTAGAYWRGEAGQPVLQRIYGTAFASKKQLHAHLQMLEEARKRDHRKLGRELKLFMFSDESPGMPFYLPRGMAIRTELEAFSRKQQISKGYQEVRTPLMLNQQLWEQSGHWDHYKDNMYFSRVDQENFALKPMNCPGHMLIYKNELHSYRDLPIRMMEFGQVHRYEYSGALNGLMRVRSFCQDDAHIYVLPDQIESEINQAIELIDEMYAVFGFDYEIELSTRPADSMGSEELWTQAEQALRSVLDNRGISYRLNEGDGAFYGPKIDFHILDALHRSWQCGTIQLDFQMPEKFNLSYIGEDSHKHRPVVIHRAIYGSIDRFIGILTEHYAGAFPLWLSPLQVRIIPVSDHYLDYALQVKKALADAGLRVDAEISSNKLGYKIREAQQEKIPYVLVVGEKEQQAGSINVRQYNQEQQIMMNVEQFITQLQDAVQQKSAF